MLSISSLVSRLFSRDSKPCFHIWGRTACSFISIVCCVAQAGCAHAQGVQPEGPAQFQVAITPGDAFTMLFATNNTEFGRMGLIAWGPQWRWVGIQQKPGFAVNGVLDATVPITFSPPAGVVNLHEVVSKTGPDTLTFKYDLTSDVDIPMTMLTNSLTFIGAFDSGTTDYTLTDGKTVQSPIPQNRAAALASIAKAVFHLHNIGDVTATFTPAISAGLENNNPRLQFAADDLPAGTKSITMTLTFPGSVEFIASKDQVTAHTKTLPGPGWFAWKPANDSGPSEIGMQSWLDGPAGKHGGVRVVGDQLQFADGTPVKFWGTNLANNNVDPPKDQADAIAARFAKYGFNGIRLHKFLNPGWEGFGSPTVSNQFDPAGLDRFDYFTAALKKHGIYYGWSHSYHYKVRIGDSPKLLNYDELQKNLGGDTYGLLDVAPDIQDVYIGMVVALLNHKNPYTGLTYAKDPALAFIEVQNEDDALFWTLSGVIDKCPTYKKALQQRFGIWLQQKYGDQAGLIAAWGHQIHPGEVVGGPIDVQCNPWFFSDDGLAQAANPQARRRLIDCALFLYHEQNQFYQKFAAAVRAAGYQGPLIGSPWWAPVTLPQYLDLKSDARVGLVDRHDYFQGSDGIFDTMLSDPGSGYLNMGLLQVAGHPFSLSEWCHVWPEVYRAEGPAIMAAYALGLQGWDASYEFQSAPSAAFRTDAGHLPWDIWDVDVPSQIGQAPSLARMIDRGDVKQGDIIAAKRVSPENLNTGTFDFSDKAVVSGDVKSFTGSVPQAALAAGRTVVEFTDKTTPSTFPDMSKYEPAPGIIQSNTDQLSWNMTKRYFTINTPGTVGVVGFAQNQNTTLNGRKINLESPYGVVIITAMERDKTLANCTKALITAVGQECNAGFSYYDIGDSVVNGGTGPIMEQGVTAQISLPGRKIQEVNILDQDGRIQPGRTVNVTAGNTFTIDTGQDQTIYYEVVFK